MPPVDDHPVHEKTRIKAGKRYGCFDKQRCVHGYYAPSRQYRTDGTYVHVMVFVENKMSRPCRYDMFENDPRCEGCDVPKDIEYLTRMGVML